jgi:hypothetical protein
MLWITADLKHALAELGEGGRQIRGCRAFANPAFAINGKDLRFADLQIGIKLYLNAAFAISTQRGCARDRGCSGFQAAG